jgi:hypothetical protein
VKGNRRKHSTRRREQNTITTTWLENELAYCEAQHDYGGAAMLRRIITIHEVPVNYEQVAYLRGVYSLADKGNTMFRDTSDAETLRNGITAALAGEVTP